MDSFALIQFLGFFVELILPVALVVAGIIYLTGKHLGPGVLLALGAGFLIAWKLLV